VAENDEWPEPTWNRYNGKHRCKADAQWQRIVANTRNGRAMYIPLMTDARQKQLELGCIGSGVLVNDDGAVRAYYQDVGQIIGASYGEETTLVWSEWGKSGRTVHGRPISKQELKRHGVQI
jgi:hypothetical protein